MADIRFLKAVFPSLLCLFLIPANVWRIPSEGDKMDQPTIAQSAPFPIEVEAGKTYYWCACGKSQKQPFCDGAHKGSTFEPVKYEAQENKAVYFCGCKHSKKGALCDGSHKNLG